MDPFEWKKRLRAELSQAEEARASGKEGMARVCARRAAGVVIAEYLKRQELPQPGESAYDLLKFLSQMPQASSQVKAVAGHFLARANPDRSLSVEADLIAEARWLAAQLL
jgi:hypothetical protein